MNELDVAWISCLENARGRFTKEWFREHPITRELLNSGILSGNVLDLGCGLGGRTYFSAINNKMSNFYGIDNSEFAINYAKKNFSAPNIEYRMGDVTSLPYKAGRFDTVFMLAVIEHIQDTDKLLREVFRVLRPKGNFFVSVTDNNYHKSVDHVHVFTEESLKRALMGKFKVHKEYVKGHIIYAVATRKPK